MPKLVDYAARFEVIREAVCAVAVRDGALAVSQLSVAREIGMSVATIKRVVCDAGVLPTLGMELGARDRGYRRHGGVLLTDGFGPEPWQDALAHLVCELPSRAERVEVETAWWRLAATFGCRHTRVQELWRVHAAALDHAAQRVVESCGAADVAGEATTLRCLVDGVTLAVCEGRLAPDDLREALRRHVEALVVDGGRRVA